MTDKTEYTLHYISADGPEDYATWSVYSEVYADKEDNEPIDGRTRWISRHTNEATADAEARRLQQN